MALTFAAATFDDHDMRYIMHINNRAMEELFCNSGCAEVLFNTLDEVRDFLTGSIPVLVEFDETPIAYFRYYFAQTNMIKIFHLGPLAIMPEYDTDVVSKMIDMFVTHVAKNTNCKYIQIEAMQSTASSFITDGYIDSAKYMSGNIPIMRLKKLVL